MERIKEALVKAGIPYVSENMGGDIEGIRVGNRYLLEHGCGTGYYFGDLEEEGPNACHTLEEVIELVAKYKEEEE